MKSADEVLVRLSMEECFFLKNTINIVVDNFITNDDGRSMAVLDACSRINKRIEDAMEGGEA